MSDQEKIGLQIEDYLSGRMSEGELAQFSQKIAIDPELQKQVELHKLANDLIINHKLQNISEIARGIEKDQAAKSNAIKFVFIGFILVLTAGLLYYLTSKKDSTNPEPNTLGEKQQAIPSGEKVAAEPVAEKITGNVQAQKPAVQNNKESKQSKYRVEVISRDETLKDSVVPTKIITESKTVAPVSIPEEAPKAHTSEKQANTTQDPCLGVHISASVSSKSSCLGQSTGSILHENVSGGRLPYSFLIVDEIGHKFNRSNGLATGNYTLQITDANHCIQLYPVTIKETHCNEDYQFNPFNGELWELPTSQQNCNLSIFEKTSGKYFEKSFKAGEQLHWDGLSNKGELKSGYFIFEIEYNDGSKRHGSITITR